MITSSAGYPAPGEMLGPYRVGQRLGGGGMGVVFEAMDTVLHRQVALKIISPHLADDESFRARFAREAQAQAALDSPHVVHVYAFGEEAGRLYIATQLVPDGDLGALLQRYGGAPVRTAVDLIAQVAAGLADAHASGLVHRDIKPANVLLRRRDQHLQAYLADFGIARQVDDQRLATTTTPGTPSYMAPELHTGGTAGVASDIYSMGCLLWATITGKAPYPEAASVYEVAGAHLHEPVPQLGGTGPLVAEVNRVLRTAMAKDPTQRYLSAADLRDDLRRVHALPEDPVLVEPRPAPPQVPVPAEPARSRVALVLVAVLVLVGVGLGAAYVVTRDDELAAGPRGEGSTGPTVTSTPSPSGSPTLSPSPTLPDPLDSITMPSLPTLSTVPSPPTTGGPVYVVQPGDREKAVASLSDQLEQSTIAQGEQADCVAEAWIDAAGLQRLVEQGFFDEQMNYHDLPADQMDPGLTGQLTTAVTDCLLG